MPWQEVSTVSLRKEFVMLALQPGANHRELCRRFNISAKTGYKFLKRYREQGDQGLADRSRRPHRSPRRTAETIEQASVALYRQFGWGGRKLRRRLLDLGYTAVPSASTLTAILHRHGLIEPEKSSQHRAFVRFERARPNELWQMDFKGHFAIDNGRCHPLTVLDDHSRFSLALVACGNERTDTVKLALVRTFRRYGLPQCLLLDNGAPWSSMAPHRLTPLSVWLLRQGIALTRSRPRHPQTLGKDERFHRTLDYELIARQRFRSLTHCQHHFRRWQHTYNFERPHESLDMNVPAHRYQPSTRAYPETLPALDYDSGELVRRVQAQGEIFLHGRVYRIPDCLRGQHVALRPSDNEPRLNVFFGSTWICEIDPRRPFR